MDHDLDLRECPFCGSQPSVLQLRPVGPNRIMIACSKRGLPSGEMECWVGPAVTGETPDEAERHWNRRDTHVEKNSRRYVELATEHLRLWTSNIGGPDTCSIMFDGPGHDIDAAIDATIARGGA